MKTKYHIVKHRRNGVHFSGFCNIRNISQTAKILNAYCLFFVFVPIAIAVGLLSELPSASLCANFPAAVGVRYQGPIPLLFCSRLPRPLGDHFA